MDKDIYYMEKAIEEAQKAYYCDEIPVGCVIVMNSKIISKGYNKKNSSNVVTQHAEIIAIEKANKKLNNWRLTDAVLYTTLEPCPMCYEVIREARIKKVVYGSKQTNNNNVIDINSMMLNDEKINNKCDSFIKKAFLKIRGKNFVSRET